ncbi:MAG: Hsp20/alpha crystallin family protein [Sulfurospirillaceae bacterium]|jgi:HSP20 family protein|nr:Hsp20/alpha crystallin family protein [Sulfurospirillaceae bacterium]MCK9546375.1 Hsp20/alpha crystallin family protein [Sulfurospirillaceae bacterium]NLM99330.1 Hsp20/alpha crystallin family protein [Campylobacteraceae bacterium]
MRLVNRYDPFRELERRFFNLPGGTQEKNNIGSFAPTVNTREDDKAYYVEVDLPGVKKDDISVDVKKDSLTVSGERKYKEEVKEENYYKSESYFGKFQRSFSLPDNADTDSISAKCEDGVLEIVLPKIAPKEVKKIEIK